MRKVANNIAFIVVFVGMMTFLVSSSSIALSPVKLGEETEVSFYGFLRNNSGVFTDGPQPFCKDCNDLATERNWFRGYMDLKTKIFPGEFRFYSAIQFAYEPFYDVEVGATSSKSAPDAGASRA